MYSVPCSSRYIYIYLEGRYRLCVMNDEGVTTYGPPLTSSCGAAVWSFRFASKVRSTHGVLRNQNVP